MADDKTLYQEVKSKLNGLKHFRLWPLNENNRPVSPWQAWQMFMNDLPRANDDLLPILPTDGIGSEEVNLEDLQGVTNQGFITKDHLMAGGYAMTEFPEASSAVSFAVINPASVPNYDRDPLAGERIEAMPLQAVLDLVLEGLSPSIAIVKKPNFVIFGHYVERQNDRVYSEVSFTEWEGTLAATPTGEFRPSGPSIFTSGGSQTYVAEMELDDETYVAYDDHEGPEAWSLSTTVPGLSIGAATGILSGTSDFDLSVNVQLTIDGNVTSLPVAIRTNILRITQGNYSLNKNAPPVTMPELYFNVLLNRATRIEVDFENYDENGKRLVNFSGYTEMSVNSTDALRRNASLYNPPAGGQSRIVLHFREVGKTTDLLIITLPQLPVNQSVPSTQYYPVNT